MNIDQLQDSWDEIKDKIKQEWNKLSNEELDDAKGKWDKIVNLIVNRYGITQQVAQKKLIEFIDDLDLNSASIKESINNTAHDFSEKTMDIAQKCCKFSKENPLTAVSLGVVSGFVIGTIISKL